LLPTVSQIAFHRREHCPVLGNVAFDSLWSLVSWLSLLSWQ
jgi:hypothetical protein